MNGYILTGWQRYDHFASLCEFLPSGIPSLKCCLIALRKGQFGLHEILDAKQSLGKDVSRYGGSQSYRFRVHHCETLYMRTQIIKKFDDLCV